LMEVGQRPADHTLHRRDGAASNESRPMCSVSIGNTATTTHSNNDAQSGRPEHVPRSTPVGRRARRHRTAGSDRRLSDRPISALGNPPILIRQAFDIGPCAVLDNHGAMTAQHPSGIRHFDRRGASHNAQRSNLERVIEVPIGGTRQRSTPSHTWGTFTRRFSPQQRCRIGEPSPSHRGIAYRTRSCLRWGASSVY
jgi:hypothetical protein